MAMQLIAGLNCNPTIKVSAIILNEGRLATELRNSGLEAHVLEENKLSFWKLAGKIQKIVSTETPHIIHAHRYKENILSCIASRNMPQIKLITTQHGLPEHITSNQSLVGKLKTDLNFWVLRRYFDSVVGVSKDIQSFLVKNKGVEDTKVSVVYNGVRIPGDKVDKPGKNNFVFGSCGRLFPVKDYLLFAEIAKFVANNGAIRFSLAGEGPERGKLENAISGYGLTQKFRFEGHVEDMDSFYRGLDVYLNTSVHEGIPMTVLEAMARGLPVVAPKVGGIPEVIQDGVEGFLVQNRDPLAFAEKCFALYRDSELRNRMSEAAKRKAEEKFSVERMTEGYLKIYSDLAEA